MSLYDNYSFKLDKVRLADTLEMEAGQPSIEAGFFESVAMGATSAAFSAVAGFVNTGVALGESIGAFEEGEYGMDTYSSLKTVVGQRTADFYAEHKTGLDALGLVAGSLVPGLGAVRALRAMQTMGKIPMAAQVATGMKNADFVLGSKAVESAKQAALRTSTIMKNQEYVDTLRVSLKQQVLENLAFEVGVVTTMNQHATLNPEGLGYFDALASQTITGLPFIGIGIGLGTAVDGMRVYGAIRKFEKVEMARTGKYAAVLTGVLDDKAPPGDKLALLVQESKRRKELIEAAPIEPNDTFAASRVAEGDKIIRTKMIEAITEMNFADEAGRLAAESIVNKASIGELADVGELLAGLSKMDLPSTNDLKTMEAFYSKSKAALGIIRADGGASDVGLKRNFEGTLNEIMLNADKIFGVEKAPSVVVDLINGINLHEDSWDILGTGSLGQATARQNEPGLIGKIQAGYDDNGRLNVALNGTILDNTNLFNMEYQAEANNILRRKFGLPEMSPEEYANHTFLHELAHTKSNSRDLLKKYDRIMGSGKGTRLFAELISATIDARGGNFFDGLADSVARVHGRAYAEELVENLSKQLAKASPARRLEIIESFFADGYVPSTKKSGSMKIGGKDVPLDKKSDELGYYLNIKELIADGYAMLADPKTRERSSRLAPTVARMISKHGGIAMPWSDTKAYYRVSTGEIMSSALPGLADVSRGKMKLLKDRAKLSLSVPQLNRVFDFNEDLFDKIADEVGIDWVSTETKLDPFEFEAQFIMAAQQKFDDFIITEQKTGVGHITIRDDNMPVMERLLTDVDNAGKLEKFALSDNLRLLNKADGSVRAVSVEDMRKHLLQLKRSNRDALAISNKYNEHEIAKILNISPSNANGDFVEDGWMEMAKRDLTKPDLVVMNYKPMDMKDVEASVKSMSAVAARAEMHANLRSVAAAKILGTYDSMLPEIRVEDVAAMSRLSSRATMVSATRGEFGSIREQMQNVGRLAEKAIQQKVAEVANDFQRFNKMFNSPDAMGLRYELAQIDNMLRRAWYVNINGTLVRRSAIQNFAEELSEESGEAISYQQAKEILRSEGDWYVDQLVGVGETAAPDAVRMSDELADFFDLHSSRNANIVEKRKAIAESKGRAAVLDDDVVYAPPMDLSRKKYIAFIAPTVHQEGADPRRYMIFAETAEEFDSKVSAIRSTYGNKYRIHTRDEVDLFKKYMGEYEEGLVFDEMFFDPNIKRKGIASELLPSADLQVSGTLERYQTWHVKQEASILRSGIEAKYADTVEYLRNMDAVTGAAERNSMNKKFRGGSTIYADSLALMLGKRATSGAVEDMYVKVNDYVGEKGSKLIDAMLGALKPSVAEGVTKEALDGFNAELAKNGFEAPFAGVMETIAISPDPQVSRALPSLVRTLNNLAGTMMLRLDMAHSIVQLISSPILAMPVLMEAKQALRGTERGAALESLTTVVNPANGVKEPSVAKLLYGGARRFWSDEGKQFMQELRSRGIVNDYLRQYQEVMDFSQLNGRHQMKAINDKIDGLAEFGSRWSGFTLSEEFTRFSVAHAAYEIGRLRGLSGNELWSVVGSAVDKVHGIYIGHQRPQLFQGTIGQAIGLYQTYLFNFAQNAMKFISDGQKKQAVAMGVLQGSIFGLQSFPGFQTFNSLIGETNRGNLDLYSVTNAEDPKSMGAYFLYGLGSHALGVPIDFYTRGDLAIRNATIVPNPFNPTEIPAVGIISRAVANIYNTVKLGFKDNVSAADAILHGLAHNGMNRPLQGIATILQGRVTSGRGQTYFENANYVGYETPDPDKDFIERALNMEINFGGMFARMIGTRPLNESIIMNTYFRHAGYQASTRKQIESLGANIQLAIQGGNLSSNELADFALSYERAGGDIQNFNAYMSRQLVNAKLGTMSQFRRELETDGIVSRAYNRMMAERSAKMPWDQE